jgi:glutamate N-acetyltransferase/amino-acid N-acetyltransferase
VSGREDRAYLKLLGKAVGNSPLVKTAIYGNDPNVGRILSALGDCAGNAGRPLDTGNIRIRIGDQTVFRDGVFSLSKQKEELLAGYLAQQSQNPRIHGYPQNDRSVDISIDLDRDSEAQAVTVYASDLGHEYVRENADYRT